VSIFCDNIVQRDLNNDTRYGVNFKVKLPPVWEDLAEDQIERAWRFLCLILREGKVTPLVGAYARRQILYCVHSLTPLKDFKERPELVRTAPWDLRNFRRGQRLHAIPVVLTEQAEEELSNEERQARRQPQRITQHKTMYQLKIPAEASGFTVLVQDPLAAALCLRYVKRMPADETLSLQTILFTLMHHGFPFLSVSAWTTTFLGEFALDRVFNSPAAHDRPIVISRYHRWNAHDYQAYRHRVYNFLRTPRGNEALRTGGIVAYLASQILGGYEAVQAPLLRSPYAYPRVVTIGDQPGFADALTVDECDFICGIYHTVKKGSDKSIHVSSYWPLQETWMRTVGGPGYWTPDAQALVDNIEWELRKHPEPKLQGEWTQLLGKFRPTQTPDAGIRLRTAEELVNIYNRV
jgi:hypothetical protein